ncbi:MAG: alpha/beta hydrolase [Dehalococcoidia bacterium]|nr:alpha/beta hydrolase [Dehalococcoidia bacterium]
MPTAPVNGTSLYYELTGLGPPLVLVHGSWGDGRNWDAVVPGLAERFAVLTYDRRGHSRSAPATSPGSMEEDALDLAALIETLGLDPANIAGNSYGAAIVLRLAPLRPELFRALAVHEPPLFGVLADDAAAQPVLAELRKRVDAVVQQLGAGDLAGGAFAFVETVGFGPGAWAKLPPAMQDLFIANALTWYDEMRDPDVFAIDLAALERFPYPAMVTRGENGPPFFAPVVAAIARALPLSNVREYTFPMAGHAPHVTTPQAYIEVTGAFFSAEGMPG